MINSRQGMAIPIMNHNSQDYYNKMCTRSSLSIFPHKLVRGSLGLTLTEELLQWIAAGEGRFIHFFRCVDASVFGSPPRHVLRPLTGLSRLSEEEKGKRIKRK